MQSGIVSGIKTEWGVMGKHPYEPLDVMRPETFKRVKAPPPELADPNDPDREGGGWFDFDTDTLEGAKNAVRPAALLLWWAAFWRLVAGLIALSQGDVGATFANSADEDTWVMTVNAIAFLAEGIVFAGVGIALFLTCSRTAAIITALLTAYVLFEKVAILLGWWEGNLLSGLIYLGLLLAATSVALVGAFNYQYMSARGLDRMPGTSEGDAAGSSETSTESS